MCSVYVYTDMCLLYVKPYITTLLLLRVTVFGLQAEDLLLELHQLTPQGVLLSQGAGDHGLGLISGQIRLQVPELLRFDTEQTAHRHSLFLIHVGKHYHASCRNHSVMVTTVAELVTCHL